MITVLALGTPVSGNLSVNGQQDLYTAGLSAGVLTTFSFVSSPGLQDLSLTITDPGGNVVSAGTPTVNLSSGRTDGNTEVYSFTAPSNGTYTLHVSSASLVGHGTYQLLEASQPTALLYDGTTGISSAPTVTSYVGPVAGLQDEYISPNNENLNITALSPNVFLRSNAGTDALKVLSGTNVLDGLQLPDRRIWNRYVLH
jgi:Bacterial pre-peptidase C-terminal domain